MNSNTSSTSAVQVGIGPLPADLDALLHLPEASFFQSPAWIGALCRADPRLTAQCITARDERGALCAAFPYVRVRRFGFERLYASAAGTYGGIVALDAESGRMVLRKLEALVRSPRRLLVRVHDFAGTLGRLGAGRRWRQVPETCQVLELPADAATLFRDVFTAQNRNKIRKAERGGVVVRCAHDRAALGRYAALLAESAARWGAADSASRSRRPLLELAGAPGVDVWLAEHAGETIAGLLNLRGGGQVMNWGNASRHDAWNLAPNNLLHWRAIEAACADAAGPRLYNFGSSEGLPNVHTFKRSFGASDRTHTRWETGIAGGRRRSGRRSTGSG